MHKLDKKDRQLLFELDSNSRISFADLGKRLKMTPEAIRYRFQKLQDEGVLTGCFAVLDSGKLGFMQYKVFVKYQSVSEEDVKAIIEYARKSNVVLRIIQFDGPFDLDIVLKVENMDELDAFLFGLIGKFNTFIRKRRVAVNVWAHYLPRAYLVEKSERTKHLERGYGTSKDRVQLDQTNKFILSKLATDARMTATEIAEALENAPLVVPISSHAVGKRIESMEESGVISGYGISIDNAPLEQICFKVLLFLNSLSENEQKRFVAYCRKHPHVVHFMRTIGDWDYELDIEVKDVRALHATIMEITREFPRVVQDYVTLHYMKTYKYRFLDLK